MVTAAKDQHVSIVIVSMLAFTSKNYSLTEFQVWLLLLYFMPLYAAITFLTLTHLTSVSIAVQMTHWHTLHLMMSAL